MAHWVPGFVVVMAVRISVMNGYPLTLKNALGAGNLGDRLATLSVAIAALFTGKIRDTASIRYN